MNEYTVVGLSPDDSWGHGLYGASFVEHIQAPGPIEAASVARAKMAAANNRDPGDYVILAIFGAHLLDLYDANLETG